MLENKAPNMLSLCCAENSPSLPSVVWPIPRRGVVMARKNAGSSSLLIHKRNHAHRSLISARSKKEVPPETLYGILSLRSAFQTAWPGGSRGTGWQSPSTQAADSYWHASWQYAWQRARLHALRCRNQQCARAHPHPVPRTASWETAWGWGQSHCWPRAGWRRWSGSSAPA